MGKTNQPLQTNLACYPLSRKIVLLRQNEVNRRVHFVQAVQKMR